MNVLLQSVRILSLSVLGFLTAFSLTPLVVKFLARVNARKHIRSASEAPIVHKFHAAKEGTPTMAGIIVWGTVVALAAVFSVLSFLFDGFWAYLNFVNRAQTYLPLAFMLIAGLAGMADDLLGVFRKGAAGGGIKVRHKLLIYSAIALLGALWFYFRLDWDMLAVPLFGGVSIGVLYIPFFIFIIVASAFSANEADGLDGLAGGVLLFAFLALTAVAFALGRYHLAAFGGVTVGALLAFLWSNVYPARFFMGDTGSMALGITMGVVALLTNTALFLPLFAPVLVIESFSVIIQIVSKKARGRKVFLSTPIHHHFQALGWHEAKVVMRFWIISAMGAAVGLALFFLNLYL